MYARLLNSVSRLKIKTNEALLLYQIAKDVVLPKHAKNMKKTSCTQLDSLSYILQKLYIFDKKYAILCRK